MPNKTLTASVKLNTRDAESKLKKLSSLIAGIDKAINGKSSGGRLEKTLGKQLLEAEKLKQATLKTELAEAKLNAQKQKNLAAQQRITAQETKSANSLTQADVAAQKLARTSYQRWWQETMATHAIGDQVAKLSEGDQAAQRLKASAEKRSRTEYEVWWQTQLVNQEYRKAHPLITKIADKIGINKDKTQEWATKQQQLLNNLNRSKTPLNSIAAKLKSIIGAYMGIQGLKLMIDTSDTITKAKNRLNALDGSSPELTEQTLDKIYAASQRARTSYSKMMSGASKSMTIAGDAFQNNIDNAIRFEEIMAKSYTIAGASADEQSNSMYQLRQALGAGILQGDELRSVMEQAPLMYDQIEKYVQDAIGTTEYSLKELASKGLVTSNMVVAAVMDAGSEIDEKFKDTSMTFEQAWEKIKNVATQVFRDVSERLEKMLNSDSGKKAIDGICSMIVVLGDVLVGLCKIIAWVVDNWGWLQHVVVGICIVIISYYLLKAAVAVYCAYQEIKAFIMANLAALTVVATIVVIIAAVLGLIYVFYLWKNGAIETCDAIVYAILIVGIAISVVMTILTGGLVLIPALVAIALALIIKHLDYFLGIVYSIGAFIYNLVVGVIDGCLQYLYYTIEPILSIVEWIYNCFNGGFNNIGDACANLVGQIISWFLSLGKVVTKIIDAIFGTNWTDGLESLRQSVTSWGKNEKAITLTQDAPTLNDLTGGALPSRISYTSAFDTGMKHGAIATDWLNNQGAKLQNSASNRLPNPNDPALAVNNQYDPSGAQADIQKAVDDVGGNVEDIKDSLSIADDDLDYLRRLAELEWRNEFTTAEIKVDMTNNNSITSERDWEGLLTYLRDTLQDEMDVVANGVHSGR